MSVTKPRELLACVATAVLCIFVLFALLRNQPDITAQFIRYETNTAIIRIVNSSGNLIDCTLEVDPLSTTNPVVQLAQHTNAIVAFPIKGTKPREVEVTYLREPTMLVDLLDLVIAVITGRSISRGEIPTLCVPLP